MITKAYSQALKKVGAILKEHRDSNELSLSDIDRYLGFKPSQEKSYQEDGGCLHTVTSEYQKMEAGVKGPSFRVLYKLARLYKVPIEDLVSIKAPKYEAPLEHKFRVDESVYSLFDLAQGLKKKSTRNKIYTYKIIGLHKNLEGEYEYIVVPKDGKNNVSTTFKEHDIVRTGEAYLFLLESLNTVFEGLDAKNNSI